MAKRLAYRSGVLTRQHRKQNARRLTVAMFHRVLARDDPRWAESDPEWTVSDELFADCLDFFSEHYSIVSLDDVARGVDALPDCPLLITFDDGWADNAEYALPLLQARNLPALCFVVSDVVDAQRTFWQEEVVAACRAGRLTPSECDALWYELGGEPLTAGAWASAAGVRKLIGKLSALPDAQREEFLRTREAKLAATSGETPMVDEMQLAKLANGGVAIGSHGKTHRPLTTVNGDLNLELASSKSALEARLARPVESLSYPHGRYDADIVRATRDAGYRFIFTSDECLNDLSRGLPDLIGRINIAAHEISNPEGRLAPELLALWLFRREATCLSV